jgi:endonuclease VIII
MAEGHVVRHNAERFTAALQGKPLVRAMWRSRRMGALRPGDLVGRHVEQVDFAGKNHLFRLDDGSTIRLHLMMFGSTQCGPPHLALRKPAERVRFLLEASDARVVAFSAPLVEHYPAGQPIPALERLGPDALKEPFDAKEVAKRLRAAPHATVAEALLDPGVVAGVGNVYKSEILWQAKVHPARAPSSLGLAEARRIARLAPLVMVEAYHALRSGAPMHQHRRVYRRTGQPCLHCGAPLRHAPTGGRRTFWCAACQPAARGAASGALPSERATPARPTRRRTPRSSPRRAAARGSTTPPRRPRR